MKIVQEIAQAEIDQGKLMYSSRDSKGRWRIRCSLISASGGYLPGFYKSRERANKVINDARKWAEESQ